MARPSRWPNQVVWSVSDETLTTVRALAKELGESESGAARILLEAGEKRLAELAADDESESVFPDFELRAQPQVLALVKERVKDHTAAIAGRPERPAR